jgi:hypothetical protein
MKIDIELLKNAIVKILDAQKELYGPTIETENDLYWFIQHEELYNPIVSPKDLTLGSLEDDWQHMESLMKEGNDPCYMAVWAAMLLRVVGEQGLNSKKMMQVPCLNRHSSPTGVNGRRRIFGRHVCTRLRHCRTMGSRRANATEIRSGLPMKGVGLPTQGTVYLGGRSKRL